MGRELSAVGAIRSLLSARASVADVVAKDVGAFFPGGALRKIDASLSTAAQDAAAGAKALIGVSDDAVTRAEHAVALLGDARARTASRELWNADRAAAKQAQDALQDAIVHARGTLVDARAEHVEALAAITSKLSSGDVGATEWRALAELSQLPIGVRPVALENVGTAELAIMREQAERLESGFASSTDPRLARLVQQVRSIDESTTRETTETMLRDAVDSVLSAKDPRQRAAGLQRIDMLQNLDPLLRPRQLASTAKVGWGEAARLVLDGANLPGSWEGFGALRRISILEHPQATLDEVLRAGPREFSAETWRKLADLTRLPGEERPVMLSQLTHSDAKSFEYAAGMIDDGISLPERWDQFARIGRLRASALWGSKSTATDHAASIIRSADPARLTHQQLEDLDGLRRLGGDLRPDFLRADDERWARALAGGGVGSEAGAPALKEVVRLGLELKSPAELRATLDRIDSHVAGLEAVQKAYTVEGPRQSLLDFRADLKLLGAFDMGEREKVLIDQMGRLVQRNIDRLDGLVGGGYGRHADYAELGRVKASVTMLTEFARVRQLGESNVEARAREAAAPAAAAMPAPQPAAGEPARELLTW